MSSVSRKSPLVVVSPRYVEKSMSWLSGTIGNGSVSISAGSVLCSMGSEFVSVGSGYVSIHLLTMSQTRNIIYYSALN